MSASPFIESIRTVLRTKHYSYQTEKTYLYWIRSFIRFSDYKHPKDMTNIEIERFLNHLAINKQVSAATQNQALCAIIFMYRYVIKRDISDLSFSFTKRQKVMPVVISADEAQQVISRMQGKYKTIAALLYGSGLRINEALRLRIKDIDFNNKTIFVFRGKGQKDRYTLLPESLIDELAQQIQISLQVHKLDLSAGYGLSSMPISLIKKYKTAAKDGAWQYVFPSSTRCVHPQDGYICRHHIHESAFRKKLRKAVLAAKLNKRVTAHTFRHSFATELLRSGADIRTVQDLLGHNDVKTTELYTHVLGTRFGYTTSPLDNLTKIKEEYATYKVA